MSKVCRFGGVVVLLAALAGVTALRGAAAAEAGCSSYSAVASASGVFVLSSAPGASPTDVDGQGPAAQAQADSTQGSNGWAGIPYSAAAANNAGAGGADATQVPVFAISQYPATPKSSHDTPGAAVESTSEERSSTARASAGGPTSESANLGNSTSNATARCADDGVVLANGHSVTQAIDIAGVLRIGSVTSDAVAKVDAAGKRAVSGTIKVEGVTVVGQTVGVGDQGLLLGGRAASPLPDASPLATVLTGAGISVKVLTVIKDDAAGDVVAPGLEVSVTRAVSGVGTGPTTTTYTFGRSHAHVAHVAHGADSGDVRSGMVESGGDSSAAALGSLPASDTPDLRAGSEPASPARTSPMTPSRSAPRSSSTSRVTAQPIANASTASLYPVLALGAVVLAAAFLLFRTLGVVRWN